MSQQFKRSGAYAIPLSGGKLYTLAAGKTNTPQDSYQDYGLTIKHPNPIPLDENGYVPPFYLADGFIKIRLNDANGLTVREVDNLLVVGPSSGTGGGGGGGVDATTVLATGDIKYRYGDGQLAGFVRANGRTIGSSTSGATERANLDTEALFNYLWQVDSTLAVSSGRGASSAADWAANKNIALPDGRGRVLAGLDTMGNSAAGRLTSTYFGSDATVLGASNGGESSTLVTANLPPYTPSGTVASTVIGSVTVTGYATSFATGSGDAAHPAMNSNGNSTYSVSGTASGSLSGVAQGGTSTPFANVQPTLLVTTYIKL
ncbi:hypothetical protein [Afipia felis]|nr:hypothetical protein [Afipia felis]